MTAVGHDVIYAVRLLRRSPVFTLTAVALLALGIGATTAIFTIVNAVLLRPLPFAASERLTMIRPTTGARVSASYLHDWRAESRALANMAGWYDAPAILTGAGAPQEVQVDRATVNFFEVLGTPAALGRTFTIGATLADVAPEVVLSHGFWQRQYGGAADVPGRSIVLDGETFTIVGVMPPRFAIRTNELAESRAEVWAPYRLVAGNRAGMGGILNVVARLAPGATHEEARAELAVIASRIERDHPSYSANWGITVVPLLDATVRDVRLRLLVVFGSVGLLLLIACANVANLILSRAEVRQSEMAIRSSLGATSGRLIRQCFTESAVLAGAGGAAGVLVALWSSALIVSALPADLQLPRTREIGTDVTVIGFALLATGLTAMLFGLLPATTTARRALLPTLREATRGAVRGQGRPGSLLTIAEIALALVLLAGAALLARSFRELNRVEPGFQPEQVLTMRTALPATRYNADRLRAFGDELLDRLERLPGVTAVGLADYLPMSDIGVGGTFIIEGREVARREDQPSSWMSVAGGRYFEAMGIPLRRGRLPGRADTALTQPVCVIDESLAAKFWPTAEAIGAHLTWRQAGNTPFSCEVIGIVGAVRWTGKASAPPSTIYWWFPQSPRAQMTIVARTRGDLATVARLMAAQVTAIDPNQPVAAIRPMGDLVAADIAQPRFTLLLAAGFALTALLLAAIGLYGVIAFGVAQRTREIGVRMALGASQHQVLRLILLRGLLLTAAGVGVGVIITLALGRYIASLLYGIAPSDLTTLVPVMLALGTVALLASYLPARRATRVDPTVALRAE